MQPIDLRSDTVTLPTPAMRAAMAQAELGDDVYGEDPTVNRLEAVAAARVGKESAMLVPSGTMGNLCAVLAHCGRGDAALIGDESHIYNYEAGGAAVLGSVVMQPLLTLPNGEVPLDRLAASVQHSGDSHAAQTRLVCLENTHNRCGGVVLGLDYMRAVHAWAREQELALHLDGARVFNAAVTLGVDVQEITQHADSVMFCLSKGLSAPVGSILAGDAALIERARRIRKMVGGGMRQAGILAAAGLVALDEMVERLQEDHTNARILAEGLSTFPQIAIELAAVQSDIVIFGLQDDRLDAAAFVGALRERGVLLGSMGHGRIRAVTHHGIDASAIEEALEAVRAVLA